MPQQELEVHLHKNCPFSLEGTGMERQMDDPLDNTEMLIKKFPSRGGSFLLQKARLDGTTWSSCIVSAHCREVVLVDL